MWNKVESQQNVAAWCKEKRSTRTPGGFMEPGDGERTAASVSLMTSSFVHRGGSHRTTWSAGREVGWICCQILWNDPGDGLWWWNEHSAALVDLPAADMPTARSPLNICGLVLSDRTVAFYCDGPKRTCATIMFNQHLDSCGSVNTDF